MVVFPTPPLVLTIEILRINTSLHMCIYVSVYMCIGVLRGETPAHIQRSPSHHRSPLHPHHSGHLCIFASSVDPASYPNLL